MNFNNYLNVKLQTIEVNKKHHIARMFLIQMGSKQITLDRLNNVVQKYNEIINNDNSEQSNTLLDTLLKNTDISLILNDFLCLLSKHQNICDSQQKQFGFCDKEKCKIYRRKCDHRNKLINNGNSLILLHANDAMYIDILDRIHCFYYHPNVCTRNRYNQMQLSLNTEMKDEINTNKMYSFGFEFKYGYNGEEVHPNHIVTSPKYSTLKDEITNNPISTISVSSFDEQYSKVLMHFNCQYRKEYYSNIKIEYLLALMIYCNFHELQYELSKTYRNNNGIYHNNYYHWGKLLKIAVKVYGTKICKGDIKSFYHGIDNELLLPQYISNGYGWYGVQIFCPLSTTSQINVASNFTTVNSGLVIEFGGDAFRCNNTKYFSVQWLSDYSYENECLFIQNEYRLQINNIINMQSGYEYKPILKALKMFNEIITGYGCGDADETVIKKMEELICKMMYDTEVQSEYVRQIYKIFCKNQKLMVLDYNEFKYKYPLLFNRLFMSDNEECEINTETLTVFTGLETLNINLSHKYLSLSSLDDLINFFDRSRLNIMEIWNLSSYFEFNQLYAIIQTYQSRFRTMKITITKHNGLYYLQLKLKQHTAVFI